MSNRLSLNILSFLCTQRLLYILIFRASQTSKRYELRPHVSVLLENRELSCT